MRIPRPEDFAAITDWGLVENPNAAIADFSERKQQARWRNQRHCRARRAYIQNQSKEFIEDSQEYYRSLDRPIDRTKWEYLKRRKGWFHPSIGWDQFSTPGVSRIVDIGCGDGDLTQRVADHIAGNWLRAGYEGFPMEIIGVDLNKSRITNARAHVRSPHDAITMRFEQGDVLDGLAYPDEYFDYALMNGLLEMFDEERIDKVLSEVARLTARGFYIRDVLDEYPGMYPRPGLGTLLSRHGFSVRSKHRVLKEPFTEEGTTDPLGVWPMDLNQVIVADADAVSSPVNRY